MKKKLNVGLTSIKTKTLINARFKKQSLEAFLEIGRIAAMFVILCALLGSKAQATIYFVDPLLGSNSNNGKSQAAPWKHIPGAYKADNTGYILGTGWPSRIVAGDEIKIKSGTTISNKLLIDNRFYDSGAVCKPITISRSTQWGNGGVVFDGTGVPMNQYDGMIVVDQRDNIVIDGASAAGFIVRNSAVAGISAIGTSVLNRMLGFTLKNTKVFGSYNFNVNLIALDSFVVDGVEIDGNSMGSRTGGFHIGGDQWFSCNNGRFINCNSHNNGPSPRTLEGGDDIWSGFWLVNSTNITFQNCIAKDNACRGFDVGSEETPPPVVTNNIKYINCESINNYAGFGCNLDNVAGLAHFYFLNCVARGNLAGFFIYNGPSAYIYNSLITGNQKGIYINAPAAYQNRTMAVELANNIFYKNTEFDLELYEVASLVNKTIVLDYNCWEYGSQRFAIYWNDSTVYDPYPYNTSSAPGSTIRSWFINHGLDEHSLCSVDGNHASFVNESQNDYHLAATSSLLKKGKIINNPAIPELLKDKDGRARSTTQAWDMGPYQK